MPSAIGQTMKGWKHSEGTGRDRTRPDPVQEDTAGQPTIQIGIIISTGQIRAKGQRVWGYEEEHQPCAWLVAAQFLPNRKLQDGSKI